MCKIKLYYYQSQLFTVWYPVYNLHGWSVNPVRRARAHYVTLPNRLLAVVFKFSATARDEPFVSVSTRVAAFYRAAVSPRVPLTSVAAFASQVRRNGDIYRFCAAHALLFLLVTMIPTNVLHEWRLTSCDCIPRSYWLERVLSQLLTLLYCTEMFYVIGWYTVFNWLMN